MTGIICVNKPAGITSFGVVAKLRGILRERKAGHTGTLDPMATGVLPVMLGGATKFLNFLPESDKAYRASFLLGKTTDTLDITGTVLQERPVTATAEDVEAALALFRGTITQLPPMYSAKSVDGVRLYALARQGIEVERKPCTVEIKTLALCGVCHGEYTIEVRCSKGTYIRSLIDDIGNQLGCGAVMTQLCRTEAMGFSLADCATLEDLQQVHDGNGDFMPWLHTPESLFAAYPKVHVSDAQAKRFMNGGALDVARLRKVPSEHTPCAVYTPDDIFLGLGQQEGDSMKVLRLLSKRD